MRKASFLPDTRPGTAIQPARPSMTDPGGSRGPGCTSHEAFGRRPTMRRRVVASPEGTDPHPRTWLIRSFHRRAGTRCRSDDRSERTFSFDGECDGATFRSRRSGRRTRSGPGSIRRDGGGARVRPATIVSDAHRPFDRSIGSYPDRSVGGSVDHQRLIGGPVHPTSKDGAAGAGQSAGRREETTA